MKTAALDVPEAILEALQREQQILLIVPGPVTAARANLDELLSLAHAAGLQCEARTANGVAALRLQGRAGAVRFLSSRQVRSYGQLRGQSLDLVLHSDDELLPEILPCLLTRRGLTVNYLTGKTAGPAVTDLVPANTQQLPWPADLAEERDLLAAVILAVGRGRLQIPRVALDTLPRDYSLQISQDTETGAITLGVYPE